MTATTQPATTLPTTHPPGSAPTTILGISAFYHDAAAALVRDGELVAAAQEERFSRKKNDPAFPRNAIDYVLRAGGVTAADVTHVVYYEKPWLKFERLLESQLAFAPRGLGSFVASMPGWLREKLFLRGHLQQALGVHRPILFCEHHESHMAAAFYPSPYERAAILTVDGVGEWATTSYGTGQGAQLRTLGELHFPHSLGLLYAAFTAYLGFEVNEGEYKVMGLAPYGEPRYVRRILDELVELRDDGSFRLHLANFDFAHGLRMTNARFAALFGGPPRAPEGPMTQRELDLARSIQVVTEEALLRMARHVQRETGEKHLVLAGGVALNCVANGRILRETPFESLWVQPAAGDAGSAVGAALAVWHRYLEQPRAPRTGGDAMQGAYLGPSYSPAQVRAFLDGAGARYQVLAADDAPDADARVADAAGKLIADGKVVGFFDGRLEFGPRALGHRSILADARSATMQRTVNLKIKFRESFRPFAPSVLRERVHEWFELDADSPYMLLVAQVQACRLRALTADEAAAVGLAKLAVPRSELPAVTHVDGSARVQTVDGVHSPRYRRLLLAFEQRTGCPVVLNTSFNVKGEPIVNTPEDAYRCFLATGMDCLVLGNNLLWREGQPALAPRPSAPRPPTPRRDLRGFGLVVGLVLVAIALFGVWRADFEPSAWRVVFWALGGVLAAAGALAPGVLRLPHRGWMGFGAVMGRVSSALILTLAHLLVLTPIGLVQRLGGRDGLRLRPSLGSYWRRRSPDPRGGERYEQLF